jgi:SAM-dependent methyltransferase
MHSYDAVFFDHVTATARLAAGRIVALLNAELRPDSVLDVGCGQGAWLAAWYALQIAESAGIDGNYVDRSRLLFPRECFHAHDLRQPFDLGRTFSLVQCLEVAEHLPAQAAEALVDCLVRHGKVILFSAAPPGQGGHDHVYERSYEHWRAQFLRRNFVALDFVRPRIVGERQIAPWYRYNPILYVQREYIHKLSPSLQASRVPELQPIADLAPLPYRLRRQLLARLPVPVLTAMARVREHLSRGQPRPLPTSEGR